MTAVGETSPLLEGSRAKCHHKSRKVKFAGLIFVFSLISVFGYVTLSRMNYLENFNAAFPSALSPIKLRIYTNNIRFDNNYGDPLERPWSLRKDSVSSSIIFNTDLGSSNVVCLQEVLSNQLSDILYTLNDNGENYDWNYYGVGRTDGIASGEYSPILFKESEWRLLDSKTFWLSETPDVPSKGWDAALERIVTMITVQSKSNPTVILNFFNTHFDHRGKMARRMSLKLIISKMKNYNSYPSFLCGDFNTQPKDEPYHILTKSGFKDSRVLIDYAHKYGHESTFTGFDKHNEARSIIDYIWAPYFAENGYTPSSIESSEWINFFNLNHHEKYKIKITSFAVLQNFFHNFYFSDHRPVVADYEVSRLIF
ncbi:uncharacterized protein PRCAT00002050001 [Priceomyces carsonii]|uniref:uncharacterized protein n=1 Tax=Priceomyces carsonii TaxID=28549 RepID=UPI002EDB019C|nr:unnamed protein product [Priceomyces carsonii]